MEEKEDFLDQLDQLSLDYAVTVPYIRWKCSSVPVCIGKLATTGTSMHTTTVGNLYLHIDAMGTGCEYDSLQVLLYRTGIQFDWLPAPIRCTRVPGGTGYRYNCTVYICRIVPGTRQTAAHIETSSFHRDVS